MEYNPPWTRNRTSLIIEKFGQNFFDGKTLLDVGAAYGDNGGVFQKLGAKVTFVEARPEWCDIIRKKFPTATVKQGDLDGEWTYGDFDIIIHWGLLYHLRDPESAIKTALSHCKHLFLESIVLDTDEEMYINVPEGGINRDHAFNGTGCRPSAAIVEKWITEAGGKFQRFDDARLELAGHDYGWKVGGSQKDSYIKNNRLIVYRRFWIVEM